MARVSGEDLPASGSLRRGPIPWGVRAGFVGADSPWDRPETTTTPDPHEWSPS